MAPPAVMAMDCVTLESLKKQKIETNSDSFNCGMTGSFPVVVPSHEDPLNWAKTARTLQRSHLEEIQRMVEAYFGAAVVAIEGASLTVGEVTVVGAGRRCRWSSGS
jgi:L-cysteine desulfidase